MKKVLFALVVCNRTFVVRVIKDDFYVRKEDFASDIKENFDVEVIWIKEIHEMLDC